MSKVATPASNKLLRKNWRTIIRLTAQINDFVVPNVQNLTVKQLKESAATVGVTSLPSDPSAAAAVIDSLHDKLAIMQVNPEVQLSGGRSGSRTGPRPARPPRCSGSRYHL